MAAKVKSNDSRKVIFGKRKGGRAKKSYNKHDRTEKIYKGQGR